MFVSKTERIKIAQDKMLEKVLKEKQQDENIKCPCCGRKIKECE